MACSSAFLLVNDLQGSRRLLAYGSWRAGRQSTVYDCLRRSLSAAELRDDGVSLEDFTEYDLSAAEVGNQQ